MEPSFNFRDLEKLVHEGNESIEDKLRDLKESLTKIEDDMTMLRNKSNSHHNDFIDALLLDD